MGAIKIQLKINNNLTIEACKIYIYRYIHEQCAKKNTQKMGKKSQENLKKKEKKKRKCCLNNKRSFQTVAHTYQMLTIRVSVCVSVI